MSIARMSVDEADIDSPSWEAVEAAIKHLDGEHVSCVFLSSQSEFPWFSIAGGKEDLVAVQFASGAARFFTLRGPKVRSGQISMVFAGQRVPLDSGELVTRALAIEAARTFWTSGQADSRFKWDPA